MRVASWFIGILAWIGPPLWAWHQMAEFDEWVRSQPHGAACGMPAMAINFCAVLASALLSLLALLTGWLAYRRLSPPSWPRRLELIGTACPLILAAALGIQASLVHIE